MLEEEKKCCYSRHIYTHNPYDVNWWKKRSHHRHHHHSNACIYIKTRSFLLLTHSLTFSSTFFCIIVELLRFLLTDCSSSTFTRCNRRKNITSFLSFSLSCARTLSFACMCTRPRKNKRKWNPRTAVAWSGNFTSSFFSFLSLSSHLYSKKFSSSCSCNLSDQFSFLHQTTTLPSMMMTSSTTRRHACLHKENSTILFV